MIVQNLYAVIRCDSPQLSGVYCVCGRRLDCKCHIARCVNQSDTVGLFGGPECCMFSVYGDKGAVALMARLPKP